MTYKCCFGFPEQHFSYVIDLYYLLLGYCRYELLQVERFEVGGILELLFLEKTLRRHQH